MTQPRGTLANRSSGRSPDLVADTAKCRAAEGHHESPTRPAEAGSQDATRGDL